MVGLDAVPVEAEADIGTGLPNFIVVGLPDTSVQEARERIKSALRNSGLPFPRHRLTVNLAPADIRKEGPAYDLPVAVATLAAMDVFGEVMLDGRLFLGELALDGAVRAVNGVLPAALLAASAGYRELYVPTANAAEASLVIRDGSDEQLRVFAVANLIELVRHLRGEEPLAPISPAMPTDDSAYDAGDFDLAYVRGQTEARRALEIAAAGGHNLLFSGPPGSGKTMLARCLPSILPPMSREETLEVTKIYSVAGLTGQGKLIVGRPFRAPHHTSSGVAVIGGGSWPKPGEVSLAHRGVLFMDELPEFPRAVLENLRQPLEDGFVTVARAQGTLKFPAKFTLVAARNPCPCGYATDPEKGCECSPTQVLKYNKRISGPLLDRIDLHVEVPKVEGKDLIGAAVASEPSAVVRERVTAARLRQAERFKKTGIFTNAEMGQRAVQKFCRLDAPAEQILRDAAARLRLSARAFSRILKVSRTIADLASSENIAAPHLAEALHFRERQG